MATVKDIARAVGVSVATVSNVLNKRPNVGEAVRRRVLEAVAEMGYQPNRAAQAMRTGRSRAIGLVLPDLTNPFFPELAQAVEQTARAAGLLVCLIDSQGSPAGESDGFDLLMQHAVDGIIWCPLGTRLPPRAREYGGPLVLVDRARPGYDVVHADYEAGGALLAAYALGQGHRRFGLLSGPPSLASARQRRDGFVATLPDTASVVWEVSLDFDGSLSPEAREQLADRGAASLIVCGNDLIAISTIRHLAGLGVQVPRDVSVVGFDNIRWADLVSPPLTTIAQPLGEIGSRAVEILRTRMRGEAPARRRTVCSVQLIERDSVRRLR